MERTEAYQRVFSLTKTGPHHHWISCWRGLIKPVLWTTNSAMVKVQETDWFSWGWY